MNEKDKPPRLFTAIPHENGLQVVFRPRKLSAEKLFQKISFRDYMTIQLLMKHAEHAGNGRVYLLDLSKHLNMPVRSISKIVRELQQKGLVHWKLDHSDSAGTYLEMTDTSYTVTAEQEAILREVYQNVIAAYGEENFIHLLGELYKLEALADEEIRKYDSDSSEPQK